MRFLVRVLVLLLFMGTGCAQKSIDATLQKFNKGSVPYISVEELLVSEDGIVLDTRKKKEYEVSHIQNAIWVGYKNFSMDNVLSKIPNKNTAIVVYCSVGVRSENIGEILIKSGYTDVKNLYGGIFEWKNQGHPVFNENGEKTNKVHAFSKQWGKLLTNAEKVYD